MGGVGRHNALVSDEELEALRRRVDALDRSIVDVLNERARVVVSIGEHKRGHDVPIYAPAREAAVLRRVLEANAGPLEDHAIEAVYRELMSASFALERALRIGYLGPAGSFSHVAASAHFGSSVTFEGLAEIGAVVTEVRRGHVDYGLVPIENTIGGGIVETLDAFIEARGEVTIYAEVLLAVRHNVLCNGEPGDVHRIHSKPEVFQQCRRWVQMHYPEAELVAAASSSRAAMIAKEAADAGEVGVAAIGSRLAGERYGLRVLFDSVEDDPDNLTRFFIIARDRAHRTGDDQTSVMFRTTDAPGSLVRVLRVFEDAGINLTHIDKRPSGRENWDYTFFVDVVGHREESEVRAALDRAAEHALELTVLGSYPRARRVLG